MKKTAINEGICTEIGIGVRESKVMATGSDSDESRTKDHRTKDH